MQTLMKRLYRCAVAAAIGAGLAAAAAAPSAADTTRYSIASSSPTGGFYRLAAAMAKFVNDKSKILRFTPLSSNGSTENCRRVGRGEVKFGMCTTIDLPNAWAGKKPFAKALTDLRTVGPDFPPVDFYMFVRKDAGVKTVQDLAGKSFGCGPPATTATQICRSVLRAAGVLDKVKLVELPFAQLASQMVNGDIVGFSRVMVGRPAGFALRLSKRVDLRVLDLGAIIDKSDLLKRSQSLSASAIPQGTYTFQPAAFRTVAFYSFFIVNKSVPDAHVYELAKLMHSQAMVDHMKTAFRFHGFYPKNKTPLTGLVVPLHPGAEKFWKEVGVEIPKAKVAK
jgi:TRAP transporter TAXI family solute receptor